MGAFFNFILKNNIKDYRNLEKTRANIFLKSTAIRQFFRKKSIESFVNKNAIHNVSDVPFIYFPLHKERLFKKHQRYQKSFKINFMKLRIGRQSNSIFLKEIPGGIVSYLKTIRPYLIKLQDR